MKNGKRKVASHKAIMLCAALLLAGCVPEEDGNGASSSDRRVRRDAEIEAREEFIQALTVTINRTQDKLAEIREREGIILHSMAALETESPEAVSEAERMEGQIAAIGSYIEAMKYEIAQVDQALRDPANAGRNTEYTRMINELWRDLEERDRVIVDLLGQIKRLKQEIARLSVVYYVVGSPKALRSRGITCRGRIFDKTRLCEVKRQYMTVGRNSDAEIYLGKSVSSYKVFTQQGNHSRLHRLVRRGGGSWLVITDPDRFWNISRDLVVEVK